MDTQELVKHAKRLRDKCGDTEQIVGTHAEACQFLKTYAGPHNTFLEALKSFDPAKLADDWASRKVSSIMQGYMDYVSAGLSIGISPERKAQLDVVSDYLEMANILLGTKEVHAAAPAMIIGATLEEFLRTWVEAEGLSLGNRKPGLEAYSQVLREADLLTKQDGKDITSWAGIRNSAAHGDWNDVADKTRIKVMLEGVNLFMRQHTP
jgi:hypothetical protein